MTDLRLAFLLWVPLFLIAVTAGFLRGSQDMALFAAAMGLAVWAACDAAVLVLRKTREYARSRRAASSGRTGTNSEAPDEATPSSPEGRR